MSRLGRYVATLLSLQVFLSVPVVSAEGVQGMDPGLRIANARQARHPAAFLNSPSTSKHYQLIAVAEQGRLQDSRPFPIASTAASNGNVGPFFFDWLASRDFSGQSPVFDDGGAVASLTIDTASKPYFYRNHADAASTNAAVARRDLPRTIYQQLPADFRDPDQSQLLNSLDDHVHLALFENDRTSSSTYIKSLTALGVTATLKSVGPELDYATNYTSDRQLKPGVGSRIVTSVAWAEDANSDGIIEQYLVELNLGGRSSNPHWQEHGFCIQDIGTHTGVISGQYMVLGEDALPPAQQIDLEQGNWQTLSVDWGRILQDLTLRDSQPCHLNATLDVIDNTIGAGVAIETRGAVVQQVLLAGMRLSDNTYNGSSDENTADEAIVTVQTASTESNIAAADIGAADTGAAEMNLSVIEPNVSRCEFNAAMERGFYSFEQSLFYVNGHHFDTGAPAYCRLVEPAPADMIVRTACGFPSDIVDAGFCQPSGASEDLRVVEESQPQEFVEAVSVESNVISWTMPAEGELHWYQVQSAIDYSNFCEGGYSCIVPAGLYQVINHSTGTVWRNIVVE